MQIMDTIIISIGPLSYLKSCAPYDMYWMEEIFADDTPMYLKLREELMKDNLFVPIAEGETLMRNDDAQIFKPVR